MLPDREKEVYEALKLTDTDEIEAGDQDLEAVTDGSEDSLTNDGSSSQAAVEGSTDPQEGENNPTVNLPPMPDSLVEGQFPTIED